ncbi:hypothetical protein [Amnibacterium kyonggiense]
MTTTTTTTATGRPAVQDDLPALTATDRAALAFGARLILRTEHHRARRAERAARAEQARTAGASARAATMRDAAFAHRTAAGTTW